jgi:hypothetical protein
MIITFFDSLGCSSKNELTVNWEQVQLAIENPTVYESKKECPLIKLAEFGQTRSNKNSLKHDDNVVYVWGLEGDYDGEQIQPEQAVAMLYKAGLKGSVHTSPSHTHEKPRWRVLLPFSRALYPEDRREQMGKLNAILGGILSTESFTLSQGFFFGTVRGMVGYKAYHTDGQFIDQVEGVLPVYPISVSSSVKERPLEHNIKIDPVTIEELRDALTHIPTDEYNERIAVGQALSSLGDVGQLLWFEWLASANREFKNPTVEKWETFTASRTGFQSVFSKAVARGWANPAKRKEIDLSKYTFDKKTPVELGGTRAGESAFKKHSIGDTLEELKKRASDENFIMEGIALQGQITVIYAKPNSGKTLITLKLLFDSIKAGRIGHGGVIYINADDTLNGYISKGELCKRCGVEMVVPAERGFDPNQLIQLMLEDVQSGIANRMTLVLDTMKKFINTMDKDKQSEFMKVVRMYTSAGGSFVMLGHVNKNRGNDGELRFAGTTDISDDSDCAYFIDELKGAGENQKKVVFINFKSRGNVEKEVVFSYTTERVKHYQTLLDSVTLEGAGAMGEFSSAPIEKDTKVNYLHEELISAFCEAINNNIINKKQLVDYVCREEKVSYHKAREILDRFTGPNYKEGHRWNFQMGPDGKTKQYFVNPPF